jgi:hypothetical protein
MKTSRDNMSLGSAGLAEGTNANTFQLAALLHFVIAGRAYRKAITDNIAMAVFPGTAFVALANHQVCTLFVMIDAAGTVTILQSAIKTASTGAGYVPGAFEWPGDYPDHACIGAIKVQTAATTFTPAATDLGAANVTDTYYDVAVDYGKPIPY